MGNDVCNDPNCQCDQWYRLLVGDPPMLVLMRCDEHDEEEPVEQVYPAPAGGAQ